MDFEKKELIKKSQNLSDWYTQVILKAELADYAPVKGTMVIRPYGYALWENVQKALNQMMEEREAGAVENAYFPLFIPYSLLKKEKEHVEGFSPELALVTIGGGKQLAEPLVVRPTSETIMYEMYSKWIQSWRDLPVLINQWNNVVRWEKRTYLFLRTMEFLWQEGHTAHETEDGAMEMVMDAANWYKRIYEEYLAVPVVLGQKSEAEKFAGAKATYGVEALMPDGKALQGGTSHNLGQNFSKVFDISYQSREGNNEYVWQTSWGLSTRSLGGMFLVHGDDQGLIMPPKVASIQVVIVPIHGDESQKTESFAKEIKDLLKKEGIRVHLDLREGQSAGRKFNEWELKGVPLRFEIGPKEAQEKSITMVRRDNRDKLKVERTDLIAKTKELMDEIQKDLFSKAKKFMDENTTEVGNYDQFKEIMKTKKGFIKAHWCEDPECEAKIKEETKATTRVKSPTQKASTGKCIVCGKEAKDIWYFAQSY